MSLIEMTASVEPHFQPFEGTGYRTQKRFPGRLLLVGESHYLGEGDDTAGFTQGILTAVIANRGTRGWRTPYFRNVFYVLTGKRSQDVNNQEWQELWNSIAFYNFVQCTRLTGPKMASTTGEWQQSRGPFRTVLLRLQPQFILATGGAVCGHITPLGTKANDRPGYYIPTHNDSTAYLRCIFHPSSTRFLGMREECRANVEELLSPKEKPINV